MDQKTAGVELRSLLREAFVRLGDEPSTGRVGIENEPPSAPIRRSSEDRSQTRQLVLEELARRRQTDQGVGTVTVGSDHHGKSGAIPSQLSLFPTDSVNSPRRSSRARHDVRDLVANAYDSLLRRLPEDHIIVNPIANAEFIVRCRELGATVSEAMLNRTLLNNRKARRHVGIVREQVPSLGPGVYDQIGHAVEIAASLVQREWFETGRELPSVDDILCGPESRHAFKTYVHALSDDADIVNCHLVLLAYRKSGNEAAQRLANTGLPDPLFTARLDHLDPVDLPESCGIYRVLCKRKAIFVSGTANLRQRILRHLSTCGGFLPERLPFAVDGPVSVQIYKAPSQWLPRRADAVARSLRIDKYPELNWREKGALFTGASHVVPRRAVC